MAEYQKKFMAVDLETTDLDMKRGRIMEVGVCEFELYCSSSTSSGTKIVKVKFGKTFSSLVNPEIEPSETALAITGIKKEELKTAPKWKDLKEQVTQFLDDSIIVGHNVEFDLGYLRNQGLRLKNPSLDTLEVARTLAPLLESHSLESLAENYHVLKDIPHRALVDCQNTARVLAAILNAFLDYPQKLQTEVKRVLGKSDINFLDLIQDLPVVHNPTQPPLSLRGGVQTPTQSPPHEGEKKEGVIDLDFADKTIFCYPLSFNRMGEALADLAARKENAVIGLSHSAFLADFRTQKLVNPRLALCEKRFSWLLFEEALSPEMAKILAKVLILRETEASLDLSRIKWSPDEIGFLHYLSVNLDLCHRHDCAYVQELNKKNTGPRIGDLETVFELGRLGVLGKSVKSILFDLSAIEDEFTATTMQIWNLRKVRNLFAPLFPVDEGQPNMTGEMPPEVGQMLNEFDLFFGVLHLVYLKRDGEFSENLVIDERERNQERFQKLFHPAHKLKDKLKKFEMYLERERKLASRELQLELEILKTALAALSMFLEIFFIASEESTISWIKFNADFVDLNLQSRDLKPVWAGFIKNFSSMTIVDTNLPAVSRAYFQKRLGLADYVYEKCFEQIKPISVPVKIFSKNSSVPEQIAFARSFSGRTLLLLPNEAKLAEMYQALSQVRMEDGTEIFAYKFSGSVGALKKKLKNFSGKNLILLLTLHALVKHWKILPELQNLVIFKLPFEARGSKPPLLGLDDHSAFVDAVLPRAINQIHRTLVSFLAAPGAGKQVFILDPRILTDYDQSFMKYFQEFPDFLISTAPNTQFSPTEAKT